MHTFFFRLIEVVILLSEFLNEYVSLPGVLSKNHGERSTSAAFGKTLVFYGGQSLHLPNAALKET